MKINIEDNFLEQEEFDELQTLMMGEDFAWYFRYRYYADPYYDKDKKDELDQFSFTHTFYVDGTSQSPHIKQINYFLELLQPVVIFRIVGNLLTRLPNIVENSFHTDMAFVLSEEKQKEWTTSIFYVNTNDGYTIFEDGTKVESVANRMLTFPANLKHTGTICTDQQTRVVINFNYYKMNTRRKS